MPLYEYTLMPTHMRSLFTPEELRAAELAPPLPFTKQAPVLRIPAIQPANRDLLARQLGTMLYDLWADPGQAQGMADSAIEQRMIDHLRSLMAANDAPAEQFIRLGLDR
jgi:hypothetical protein